MAAGKIKVNINNKTREKSPSRDGTPEEKTYRERSERSSGVKEEDGEVIERKEEHNRGRKRQTEEEAVEVTADDEMMKLMGFGGFGTTKNKKVEGTNVFGASEVKKSEYRQYMNREKGFNRSLSPTPEEKKQLKKESKQQQQHKKDSDSQKNKKQDNNQEI